MKTILVPADFSPATDTAIAYAAALAGVTHSSVCLVHTYQIPVAMNEVPVLAVSSIDMKASVDAGLNSSREEAQKRFPAIRFETASRLGDSDEEIEALATEKDALCIVTGLQKLSGLENFLLGNEAMSLIRHCSYPVVAIPEGAPAAPPKKIALAIDLAHTDEIPVQKISAFVQAVGAQLHLVHVETEEGGPDAAQQIKDLFGALPVTYHAVKNEEVVEGITTYLSQNTADLLMVLPHRHNLFERLFAKEHTPEILAEASLPVVCIRS